MLSSTQAQMVNRLVSKTEHVIGLRWEVLKDDQAAKIRALAAEYIPLLMHAAVEWGQGQNSYSAIIVPHYDGAKIASWKATVRHPDGTLAHVTVHHENDETPLITFAELETRLQEFTALSPKVGKQETYPPGLTLTWRGNDEIGHRHSYEQARVIPMETHYGSDYERDQQWQQHALHLLERAMEARAPEFPFANISSMSFFARHLFEKDSRHHRQTLAEKAAEMARDAFFPTLDAGICTLLLAGDTNLYDQLSHYNLLLRDPARRAVLTQYPFLAEGMFGLEDLRRQNAGDRLALLNALVTATEALVAAYGTAEEPARRYALFDAVAGYFKLPTDPYQHTKTSAEVPFHHFLLERLSGMPASVGNHHADMWLTTEVARLPRRFLAFLYPPGEEDRAPQVGAYMDFVRLCRRLAFALPHGMNDFHGDKAFYAMIANPSSAGPVLGDAGKLVNQGGFGGAAPNAVGLLTTL
ncbi:MAG: hypothetical protein J0L97_00645, partial [Alphaproteobacteria bacterium]|nr:hypothetical protein [Alphaproteobacteria bacterium]